MNAVDIIIILLAVLSVARGYRIGLVRQAGSTIGFLVGLFVGSWVGNFLVGYENDSATKLITSLTAVLLGGFVCMTIGEIVGIRIKERLMHSHSLDTFDGGLGSIMAIATTLFAVWLGASILVLGPSTGLQQSFNNSRILSSLNNALPPATSLLSSLNKLINPNGFPEVFRGLEPSPGGATIPSLGSFNSAVEADRASVVKVEGTGCGGIVEGSGFIVKTGEIATNAHVVAGVANPKIIDENRTVHSTRVVWFDPDVDLAVLQVQGLGGKPLPINSTEQPADTPAAVLGYPGGGDFNAQAGAVIDHFSAYGRNIYGQGTTARDVYSVHAHIIPGNSGGPLIGKDGSVLGIVFATSTTYNNVGYALTGHQVASELAVAEQSNTTRDTGTCSE